MHKLRIAAAAIAATGAVAAANAAATSTAPRRTTAVDPRSFHLDLEMTGAEWRELESIVGGFGSELEADEPLQAVLDLGKRNLDWLAALNAARQDGTKLELSTPATQRGIPITAPKESNREIVLADVAALRASMPAPMADVLWGAGELPSVLPEGVTDDAYLEYARLLDRAYQGASRWLLQEPWLEYYAEYSVKDVRGYYFLVREPDLDAKLDGWERVDAKTKERLSTLLVGLCRNSAQAVAECRDELNDELAKSGTPRTFYDQYLPVGKETYDAFFALQNPRPEAEWTSADPNRFTFPFSWPASEDVRVWLAENVEDEWRFGDWQLRMQFDHNRTGLAQLVFEPGATPHVNGLGGDTITMDANRDIQEYTTRWTIRHEFGHVLGLPDCYVEFYDADRGVMINYQIDIDDLMCSRKGRIQAHHVEELRKHYFRAL